jgi:hypothetical protein
LGTPKFLRIRESPSHFQHEDISSFCRLGKL